jgi:microsomal prostaglandin-E synthase 1
MPHPDRVSDGAVLMAYSLTGTLLCLNMLLLWIASGATRARTGIAINPEDGVRYGAPVSDLDPPAVARILRAHRNAEAGIYPFLLLGLLYVLAGGTLRFAAPIFAVFVIARLVHTWSYLAAKQPVRTISFAVSLLATLALLLADWGILIVRLHSPH